MFLNSDGVALVTGAASGIGAATARAFVANGVKHLVLADIMSALFDVGGELEKQGAQILAVKCDISDENAVNDLITRAVDKFGRIDYAANCAGVLDSRRFADAKASDWDRVMNINARGTFFCLKAQIKQMQRQDPLPSAGVNPNRQQRGSIVNVSSSLGERAVPLASMYCSSKHAEIGLTKAAAIEYAQEGIRINTVAPGIIETTMTSTPFGRPFLERQSQADRTPMARPGMPDEIADVIVFMLSDRASFVTGATWNVDGGMTVY